MFFCVHVPVRYFVLHPSNTPHKIPTPLSSPATKTITTGVADNQVHAADQPIEQAPKPTHAHAHAHAHAHTFFFINVFGRVDLNLIFAITIRPATPPHLLLTAGAAINNQQPAAAASRPTHRPGHAMHSAIAAIHLPPPPLHSTREKRIRPP